MVLSVSDELYRQPGVLVIEVQLNLSTSPERIQYKLDVLMFKCFHGTTPPYMYLADEFLQSSDL